MKTFAEVAQWCAGAAQQFGDPSTPVCQLFFRWQDNLDTYRGEELVFGWHAGELVLLLAHEFQSIPIDIEDVPRFGPAGELVAFGAFGVTLGVWALNPSLNAEGLIHAFIVLYGVPYPAPWERRILLPYFS